MSRRRTPPIDRLRERPMAVGLVVALAALALAVLAFASTNGVPGLPKTKIVATLPSGAAGIRPGVEVRVAGQHAGVVDQVRRTAGYRQRVRMVLRIPAVGRDAKLNLRLRAPAGQHYIALDPGDTRDPLPDGGAIAAANARAALDLITVVDGFDAAARSNTRKTVQLAGTGLVARGDDLNAALRDIDGTLGRADQLLRAAAPGDDLPALVQGAGAVAGGLAGENPGDLGDAVGATGRVLEQTSDPAARLGENIALLPETERRLLRSGPATRRLLDRTAVLARRLRPTSAALRDVLPAVERLLASGPLLDTTVPAIVRAAVPALRATAPILRRVGVSAQLVTQTVPGLRTLAGYLAGFPREIDSGLASYYVPSLYDPNVGKAPGYTVAPAMLILTCAPGYREQPEPGSIFTDRLDRPCR